MTAEIMSLIDNPQDVVGEDNISKSIWLKDHLNIFGSIVLFEWISDLAVSFDQRCGETNWDDYEGDDYETEMVKFIYDKINSYKGGH